MRIDLFEFFGIWRKVYYTLFNRQTKRQMIRINNYNEVERCSGGSVYIFYN